MGIQKFGMKHPFLLMFIIVYIGFLVFIPCLYFSFHFNLIESVLIGSFVDLLFSIFFVLFALKRTKGKEYKKFVWNLGSIVKNKSLNSISTNDFDKLTISYYGRTKYNKSKNVGFSDPDGTMGTLGNVADSMLDSGKKFYTKFEKKFMFSFLIPKSIVHLEIPDFIYSRSLQNFLTGFKNWRNEYPALSSITQKIPSWVQSFEIYQKDGNVFVNVLIDEETCLNSSLEVYNTLVEIKNNLIKSQNL